MNISSLRAGFGQGLLAAAQKDKRIVGLCADLTDSTKMRAFADQFPDRFFEVGVAEQNLVTVASGLASQGLIPFVASYAAFSPGRNWEQIKTTICLNNQPVKIVGAHTGLGVGPDGATHQMLEDIALMRVLPNMTVLAPADGQQAYLATLALAQTDRPGYLRLARQQTPQLTDSNFEIGPAYVYREGGDVALFSTGIMLGPCLEAADELESDGIKVCLVHLPTIKPLDKETVLRCAQKTGCGLVIEDHQRAGGLGGLLAETFAQNYPIPLQFLGVNDRFGQSGRPEELFSEYGLSKQDIVEATKQILERKVKR